MREDELFAIFIKCLLRDMLTAKIMVFILRVDFGSV